MNRSTLYLPGWPVPEEEGPAISAQILGVDATRPERIAIGTPLQVAFVRRGDGANQRTFLAFQSG